MTASMVRLHISPFNSDLLPSILGPEISKLASNTSFHSLQTFPESDYGFVDLPKMEAEKVRKKINGAILKGKKIQVEEARPKRRKQSGEAVGDQEQAEQIAVKPVREPSKSLAKDNVISGHELAAGRKVKRGWTESATNKPKGKDKAKSQAKPQTPSKHSDKNELLFRTKIPKNKSAFVLPNIDRSQGSRSSVVVHEFEKSTTTPSFLRENATKTQTDVTYQDGKGWIDGKGNIVEHENTRASKRRKTAQSGTEKEVVDAQKHHNAERSTSNVGASASAIGTATKLYPTSELGSGDASRASTEETRQTTAAAIDDDSTSSGTSASESLSSPISSTVSDSLQSRDDQATPTNSPPRVIHPLESLFKKPIKPASSHSTAGSHDVAKPSLEIQTSFSFFESHEDNDHLPPIPTTPFSSHDLRKREIRSAAPTPDTAHPNRMSDIFNGIESEGELSEMEDAVFEREESQDNQTRPVDRPTLELPQTDFEKQFWEKRGENNRAWKARRRAVLKERRQKENRARRPKNW